MKPNDPTTKPPILAMLVATIWLAGCTSTTVFKHDYQTGELVGQRFQQNPPGPPVGDEISQTEGAGVIIAYSGRTAVELRAGANDPRANLWHISAPLLAEAGDRIVATWNGDWPAVGAPSRLSVNLVAWRDPLAASPEPGVLGRIEIKEGRLWLFGDETLLVSRDIGAVVPGSHTVLLTANSATGKMHVFLQQPRRRAISGEVASVPAGRLAGATQVQLGFIVDKGIGEQANYILDDVLVVQGR